MVAVVDGKNQNGIDFSIMPTLECNLKCSFCMYDCSADSKLQIDFRKLKRFLYSIPTGLVNSFGLYGGEPSINIPLYERVIALLPRLTPKFVITNGTWTKPYNDQFPAFVSKYGLQCFISSTPEHKMFQDSYITRVISDSFGNYTIKDDDTQKRLSPMGRNATGKWSCTGRCLNNKKPRRFAAMPDGNIIFQSCDGVYPVVGCIDSPFNLKVYLKQITGCQTRNKYE